MTQVNHLDSKLKRATEIQDKIRIIENNPACLTNRNIKAIIKKTEEQISAALKIASKIDEIKLKPDYLDRYQIQILQEQVSVLTVKFGYNEQLCTI